MQVDQRILQVLCENLKSDILGGDTPYVERGEKVHPLDALFCYRILLGRSPFGKDELDNIMTNGCTYREFLNGILSSDEFGGKLDFLPSGISLMTRANGFRFWFDSGDSEMGGKMATSSYEPETVALMRKLIKKDMNCLDIGAQTGFYSCLMASLVGGKGKVLAFEPMERSYELLSNNIAENDFGNIVTVHKAACAEHTGYIRADFASGMAVASQNGRETLKSIRLDDEGLTGIDFCKIDIEGHEEAALKGMEKLIVDCAPLILTEVNNYWLCQAGSSPAKYMDLLESMRYQLYTYEGGFREAVKSEPRHALENFNLLAVPEGRKNEVLAVLDDH